MASKLSFDIDLDHSVLHLDVIDHHTSCLLPATAEEEDELEDRRDQLVQEAERHHQRSGSHARKGLAPWHSHPGAKPSIDRVVA